MKSGNLLIDKLEELNENLKEMKTELKEIKENSKK